MPHMHRLSRSNPTIHDDMDTGEVEIVTVQGGGHSVSTYNTDPDCTPSKAGYELSDDDYPTRIRPADTSQGRW